MTPSRWIKCISVHGNIRGTAIEARELVQQAADLHGQEEGGIQAIGEALVGALLIASFCKDQEKINLNVRGAGRVALVDAHPDGKVRGYVVQPSPSAVPSPELPDDGIVFEAVDPDPVGPWGKGLLSVLRTKTQDREQPYIGTVPLLTGHLAKDLTFYWMQSEQIPSAVGLAVELREGRVVAAGGFLVQALPGASASEIEMIEKHIHEIQSLGRIISENPDPMRILSHIFQSTAFMVLDEKPLVLDCDCSWERVKRALTLVGVKELRSMLAEDHEASVRCDFCTKEYRLNAEELEALIEAARSLSS